MIFKEGDHYSEQFPVSDGVYIGFIDLFKDHNPLHTDEKYAFSKGFMGKVMHGNILNGFLSYFIGECLPLKNVIIHSQSIQYKKPVYLNDSLVFEAVVTGIFEAVNAVEFKFIFKNRKEEIIAKGKFQIGILQ